MNRLGKKIAALVLAAVVAVSTVTCAFAANSPINGNMDSTTTFSGNNTSKNTMTITSVSSTTDVATIPSYVTIKGVQYYVTEIATGAINKTYDSVTIVMNSDTIISARIMKSKKARKTSRIVIRAASGKKLKASQFDMEAFKKYKGKIIVKKSAMSKKQFKQLKTWLFMGGFKGTIKRKS